MFRRLPSFFSSLRATILSSLLPLLHCVLLWTVYSSSSCIASFFFPSHLPLSFLPSFLSSSFLPLMLDFLHLFLLSFPTSFLLSFLPALSLAFLPLLCTGRTRTRREGRRGWRSWECREFWFFSSDYRDFGRVCSLRLTLSVCVVY